MKFLIFLIALISHATGVLSQLVSLTNKLHPLGHDRGNMSETSFAPSTFRNAALKQNVELPNDIKKEDGSESRACWFGSPYGCSKSYCWTTCGGDGEWCWTVTTDQK